MGMDAEMLMDSRVNCVIDINYGRVTRDHRQIRQASSSGFTPLASAYACDFYPDAR